ncbi:hypothetical protein PVAP13_5KG347607 [Panicum virgatum]|uniref:Uncharacterized protein n=1 Tax=Panicum virgatum TaxID=38727 RepID=A0A8T0SEX2_PANVG|nr:hypothetical protein PVAP13_5KG347607 [Panicum virgatum]
MSGTSATPPFAAITAPVSSAPPPHSAPAAAFRTGRRRHPPAPISAAAYESTTNHLRFPIHRELRRSAHPHDRHLRPAATNESIRDSFGHRGRAATGVLRRTGRLRARDVPRRCATTTAGISNPRHARLRRDSTSSAIVVGRRPHRTTTPTHSNHPDSISPLPIPNPHLPAPATRYLR